MSEHDTSRIAGVEHTSPNGSWVDTTVELTTIEEPPREEDENDRYAVPAEALPTSAELLEMGDPWVCRDCGDYVTRIDNPEHGGPPRWTHTYSLEAGAWGPGPGDCTNPVGIPAALYDLGPTCTFGWSGAKVQSCDRDRLEDSPYCAVHAEQMSY